MKDTENGSKMPPEPSTEPSRPSPQPKDSQLGRRYSLGSGKGTVVVYLPGDPGYEEARARREASQRQKADLGRASQQAQQPDLPKQ